MAKNKVELLEDTLPEHILYRDEGCNWFSSCLGCPLARCRYDDPGWVQEEARQRRDKEVLRTRRAEGKSIVELARAFAISTRTVHRILSRRDSSRRSNHG